MAINLKKTAPFLSTLLLLALNACHEAESVEHGLNTINELSESQIMIDSMSTNDRLVSDQNKACGNFNALAQAKVLPTPKGAPVATQVAANSKFVFSSTARSFRCALNLHAVGCELEGLIHVYAQSEEGWQIVQRLNESQPQQSDFGSNITVSENIIAVAAPSYQDCRDGSTNCQDAGYVEIFALNAGHWEFDGRVSAPEQGEKLAFGSAMAFSSENGVQKLFVGAPGTQGCSQKTFSCNNAGAVYAFEKTGGTWQAVERIQPSNLDYGYRFGNAVASDQGRLIVGAPGANACTGQDGSRAEGDAISCAAAGAIYVYETAGAKHALAQKITEPARTLQAVSMGADLGAANGRIFSPMGYASLCDVDNEGFERCQRANGLVPVYEYGPNGWTRQHIIRPSAQGNLGAPITACGNDLITLEHRSNSDIGGHLVLNHHRITPDGVSKEATLVQADVADVIEGKPYFESLTLSPAGLFGVYRTGVHHDDPTRTHGLVMW